MKILIIGNSKHLIESIRLSYPNAEIEIIGWRSNFNMLESKYFDLIYVVGYDYSSYAKIFDDYIRVNVFDPLHFLGRIVCDSTDIVYICTAINSNRYTYSRYRYAKELFANMLTDNFKNSYIIRFDTFLTAVGEPVIKGGCITYCIFRMLIFLRRLNAIHMQSVAYRLKAYKNYCSTDNGPIKGVLIHVPRTKFLDRILRLLIA
jgi:hypothetical protein